LPCGIKYSSQGGGFAVESFFTVLLSKQRYADSITKDLKAKSLSLSDIWGGRVA
jgi:hypothetical protein